MARNGSGVYSLPAGNPVVTGTTISSTWANTTLSDISTALTGSVASDGQTAMTGNLQMGNNKITGLAVATASGDALSYGQAANISALTVTGAFAANGGATLGDASGDALTINSSAVSIPNGLNFDSNTLVIDATNNRVGVGTASPADRFEVAGSTGNIQIASAGNRISYTRNGANYIGASGASASLNYAAETHAFYNGAETTERMRLDSSGNLGLGVTPSAWGSAVKAMQIGQGAGFSGNSSSPRAYVTGNAYYNGTDWIRIGASAPTFYEVDGSNGTFSWNRAASSTAGSTITWSQVMTLNASGQLLVGTTSARTNPTSTLSLLQIESVGTEASQSITRNSANNGGPALVLSKSRGTTNGSFTVVASGDVLGGIGFNGADGTALIQGAYISALVDGTPSTNDMPTRLIFGTTADGASSPTERVRITSDGYLRMASGSLGIQFNGDTAAANALNDYEEGTFTPTISGSTTAGAGTYTNRVGRYTKVGNRVHFAIYLLWSAHTGTGNLLLSGLPFTVSDNTYPAVAIFSNSLALTANSYPIGYVDNSGTSIILRQTVTGSSNSLVIPMDTAATIFVSGQYTVS